MILPRGEHDLDPRSGLTIGKKDQAGEPVGAMELEVKGLPALGAAEGTRLGRLVARSLYPDEPGFARLIELDGVLTARDVDALMLVPVDPVPIFEPAAQDDADSGHRASGLGVGHATGDHQLWI